MKIDYGFSKYRSGGLTPGDLERMGGSVITDSGVDGFFSFDAAEPVADFSNDVVDDIVEREASILKAKAEKMAFRAGLVALAEEMNADGEACAMPTVGRALIARLDKKSGWDQVGEEMNRLYGQLRGENGLHGKIAKETKKAKKAQNAGYIRSLRARIEKAEKQAEMYCLAVFTAAGGVPPFLSKAQAKLMEQYGPLVVVERKLGRLTAKKARGVEGLEGEIRALRQKETSLVAHVLQVRGGVPQFLADTKAYKNWERSVDFAEAKAGAEKAKAREAKAKKPAPRARRSR